MARSATTIRWTADQKREVSAFAAVLFGLAPVFAGEPATPPSAETAWAACRDAIMSSPGDLKGKSRPEQMRMMDARNLRIRDTHLAFFENFPADVRRWEAVLTLQLYVPQFYTDATVDDKPVADQAKAAAWKTRRAELLAEMGRALPGLPPTLQQRYESRPLFDEIGTLYGKLERKEKVDWPAVRAKVDAHLAKFPQEAGIAGLVSRYMGMYERDHSAQQSLAEWRALTQNPIIRQNDMVKKRLDVIEREMSKPMEMAFTAADGREVDLTKLRGKVVLIDFWATWCGPCIAELPNVKEVYAKYRARGFEVIGISLENADLKPNDTPEEVAAKHARAKKKLLDFAAKENVPWPQHYDGKYWNNDIARGRFNVSAVPATFLLDRQGMIAAVGVRGPQLETEVQRLLKD
jgi:thiol-disulfide isomerase/thioredoxin